MPLPHIFPFEPSALYIDIWKSDPGSVGGSITISPSLPMPKCRSLSFRGDPAPLRLRNGLSDTVHVDIVIAAALHFGKSDLHAETSVRDCPSSEIQACTLASDGMRQSPRGESATEPTFGPSGMQERLNCCVKKRQ
jgi:hypothetical protein